MTFCTCCSTLGLKCLLFKSLDLCLCESVLNISKEPFGKAAADLDQVQDAELALRRVHAEDKVESGVVPVNQLVVGTADETESR